MTVSSAVYDELIALGITATIVSIGVVDDADKDIFRVVPTREVGPVEWFTVTREEWVANPTLGRATASWDRGDPWITWRIEGDEAIAFDEYWENSGGVGGPRTELTMATVWFSRGWLYLDLAHPKEGGEHGEMVAADPLDEEQLAMVKRFADTFDFAYGRYLELKQKEDQNRELTIQNAIERVRAQAQGMQESREIADVAQVIYDEFISLGHDLVSANISVIDRDNDAFHAWLVGNPETSAITKRLRETHKLGQSKLSAMKARGAAVMVEAWSGEDDPVSVRELEGNELRQHRHRQGESMGFDDEGWKLWEAQQELEPDRVVIHGLPYSRGLVFMTAPERLQDEAIGTARRLVAVFEFAFSRFLELKQKEDQNRELRIQNSLERIRARAVGMQESDEISEVAVTMWREFGELDITIRRPAIVLADLAANSVEIWATTVDGEPMHVTRVDADRFGSSPAPAMRQLSEAFAVGDRSARTASFDRNAFATHLEWMRDDLGLVFPNYDRDGIPDHTVYHALYFDEGYLLLNTFSEELPKDEVEIAQRFADEFAVAYRRFKELKEKEEQNRELTVQNALERVRARALGMQESRELDDVSMVLSGALSELGIDFYWCGFVLFDEPGDLITLSVHVTGVDELVQSFASIHETSAASSTTKAIMDAFRSKEEGYVLEVTGENVKTHLDVWAVQIQEMNPHYRIPDSLYEADLVVQNGTFFTDGLLEVATPSLLDEDAKDVQKRFTVVFEFAYNRFLELKEKEERAREAEQRAAVDRMRAEATAMESTEDIANVVKTLWEGLVAQGLDFTTLNFRVEDREADELQMYLATHTDSEGLTFPEERLLTRDMLDGVNLYRSTMPLAETKGERLRGSYGGLSEGVSHDFRTLWGFDLPADFQEAVQRVIVPFDFGQISVVRGGEPFVEADIELVEPFAEGVSLGFTRYFDFQALEAKNVDLEEANEQIQEATRLKSQFLATMSHELRTPMNAIIGFTRLVTRRRAENLTDRQRENLDKVQLSADHLLNLINEILDLSKVEAGRVEIEPTTFKIAPLVQGACDTVGPTLGKTGVEVICEVEDDLGEAHTDDARLRQIVINLLSNALKFTDQGEVRVAVRSEKGEGRREGGSPTASDLVIAVSDTGIGIPEDELGNIFEEFRQVDGSSTRRHQGTGLGLAITKKLVELLGGEIGVASEVGVGSTFTFRIPSHFGNELSGGAGEPSIRLLRRLRSGREREKQRP